MVLTQKKTASQRTKKGREKRKITGSVRDSKPTRPREKNKEKQRERERKKEKRRERKRRKEKGEKEGLFLTLSMLSITGVTTLLGESRIRASKGSSQPTLHSQWLGRKEKERWEGMWRDRITEEEARGEIE